MAWNVSSKFTGKISSRYPCPKLAQFDRSFSMRHCEILAHFDLGASNRPIEQVRVIALRFRGLGHHKLRKTIHSGQLQDRTNEAQIWKSCKSATISFCRTPPRRSDYSAIQTQRRAQRAPAMLMGMKADDLKYAALKELIEPVESRTGLGESAAFLVWFLENVYRLDETEARDAVCDNPNDKGIDGIYIDHNNEEVHFFQAKIRQNERGAVGDVGPKNLMASVQQFDSAEGINTVLSGNANAELKRLVNRTQLIDMVATGYSLVGVYASNELHNEDSENYESITPNVRIFERSAIALRVIEIDSNEGKKDAFTFDTSYVDPMKMQVLAGANKTSMYVFPARALQLVNMEGIADGSLFKENVRYTLGNTAVNKSIRKTIASKPSHPNFALFHNGIILLCAEADDSKPGELTVRKYSVVNGAQSLTSFHNEKSKLTGDLRVLVRVIEVQDEALSRTITENSNNQNAIKPRDLRSNHAIMLRLQNETMSQFRGKYFFEIKRGEKCPPGATVITNDEVGRALLAFDLREPWSAHQIYKVFDEKYAQIFGRPEVDASRVVFMFRLLAIVDDALPKLKNRPMASYTLTRYFLLYVLSHILRSSDASLFVSDPSLLDGDGMEQFFLLCAEVMKTVVVDLNYESNSIEFDYKSVLKSPNQLAAVGENMLASYEKDVERDKAASFHGWRPESGVGPGVDATVD